ncbi:MAG: NAD-dependent epimerase/dehydratase family protein [Negativicutes bacterium]|nr:NAD-dependent epimerase/dehydratase family protein [Negativicutes bacterium]
MATYLILGGCGFIGRHVALALARRGERVRLADRSPLASPLPGVEPSLVEWLPFEMIGGDWDRLIADISVIYHCAWSSLPQTANDDPIGDLQVNVVGSLGLLEALRRRGGGKIVFLSSGGTVYGRLTQIPVPEDHPLDPLTAYGVGKVAVEKYLHLYCALHNVDARVARLSNPFGAGQDPRHNQGAASIFLRRAMASQPLTIWGDGWVVRDYIHITDAAAGLLALADADLTAQTGPAVFNIGSGEGVSLNDIVKVLRSHLGYPIEVQYAAGRPFDVPISILDITRARQVLGWAPHLSFAEGIDRTIVDLRAGAELFSSIPHNGIPA